jgi:pimeloyl-ACP methyl ester carboxylesterase
MSRLRVALVLLLFVVASLGGGAAIAAPVEQGAWTSLKKDVRLPNGVRLAWNPLFPAEHHESLLKAFPGAEAHVFPELGHNPNWERPDLVAAAIKRFLSSQH